MSDEPLRIGFLLSSLGLMRGGLETIAAQLAGGLARRGHDVTVVAGRWPGRPLPADLAALPVRWLRVPCLPLDHPLWQRWPEERKPGLSLKVQSLSFYHACRWHPVVRARLPALDVTVSFLEVETVKFSTWRGRAARPHVSYFPGCIDRDWLQRDRSTLRVAISESVAVRARRALGLEIDGVVPPGIAGHWLDSAYTVRPQARGLVFVGRLEANKGVRELVAIFKALAAQSPDVQLRLVGHGPLRAWVEAERARLGLASRIACGGTLPPAGVRRALQEADLFVLPSHYESWGIAALEALAVGVPAVCSDLPALREATRGAACLLPAGDVGTWVETLGALLSDRATRERLFRAGRARARELTWSRVTREMEGYLYRALAPSA